MKFNIVKRVTSSAPNPIADLSHDHGDVTVLVLDVGALLGRMERGDLSFEEGVEELHTAVETLRDALLVHFAREEEGLFPFVELHATALLPRMEALRADHEVVCARANELSVASTQAVHEGAGLAACSSCFSRFEERYAGHAREELSFLRDVDAALDVDAKERLRELLAAI